MTFSDFTKQELGKLAVETLMTLDQSGIPEKKAKGRTTRKVMGDGGGKKLMQGRVTEKKKICKE